jgi:hypothetical protein
LILVKVIIVRLGNNPQGDFAAPAEPILPARDQLRRRSFVLATAQP